MSDPPAADDCQTRARCAVRAPRGILHLDIKPGNIFSMQKGEPHLTDFGWLGLTLMKARTRTIETLGHAGYMAPERRSAIITRLTRATDVYGLGACFTISSL